MAVDLDKIRKDKKKYKERKEQFESGKRISYLKIKPDDHIFVYLCPPHEAMNGRPWTNNLVHKRDIQKGVKGNFYILCQRKNDEDPLNTCPPCAMVKKFREKKNAASSEVEKKKIDEKIYKMVATHRYLSQVVDFSPFFNERGEKIQKIPKCFLAFEEVDECPTCPFREQCEAGVQRYAMPKGVWEEFSDHLDDEGDITEPENALPVRIKRTGSGVKNTSYKTKVARERIKIPQSVFERIDSKIMDLVAVDVRPTGTSEEIEKIYDDFFNMRDIQDRESEEDSDLPECYQEYDPEKKKKRGCKECSVYKSCKEFYLANKVQDDEDDDESVDEDDEDSMGNIRGKLYDKAKKGKLNR